MRKLPKIKRASLKERLHFLFSGEIKDYWQRAESTVFQTHYRYLLSEAHKLGLTSEEKKTLTDYMFSIRTKQQEMSKYITRKTFKDDPPDYLPFSLCEVRKDSESE